MKWTMEKAKEEAANFAILLTLAEISYDCFDVDRTKLLNYPQNEVQYFYYLGDYQRYKVEIAYPYPKVSFCDLYSNRSWWDEEAERKCYSSVQEMIDNEEFFKKLKV